MSSETQPLSGYDKRKKRKREQILNAATELFKNQGFSRVSVSQVAAYARVSQVTIYNHFGDKRSLVEAVVERISGQKLKEYTNIIQSGAPWMERLRAVIIDKKRLFQDFLGELYETLYHEYPESVRRLKEIKAQVQEDITYPFLDEGRRLGLVPKDVSNAAVAAYLQVVMRGFDESPEVVHGISEDPEIFDQVYDLIVFGLVDRSALNRE